MAKSVLRAAELYDLACESCGCNNPNCGLTLGPKCHPKAGTRVKFFKMTRTLDVTCAECDRLVARLSELGGPATEPRPS